MLELQKVSKQYSGGKRIFEELDYALADGEYVAIMGESGVGKSTLLNLIAGLDTPDGGDILIDGTSISVLNDDAATLLRRQKLGFIFQAFHILPHLNIYQNVAVPLRLNSLPAVRAHELLDAVGLAGRANDFPRQLSGGELQRVAIARALVHKPKLVLADEPTGNLDPDTAHEILLLLRNEIKGNGASGILVTHSHAAAATADRVFILTRQGLQLAPGSSHRLV
jgi:putative ABC transport system ATP-binding protein